MLCFRIKKSLVKFLNLDACSSTVHWLLAIPLVHFLDGVSRPFQNLSHMTPVQHNAKSGEWWGEGCIKQATEQSKVPSRNAEM